MSNLGQFLYNEAIKQLQILENKYKLHNKKSSKAAKKSVTDHIIHKIANIVWTSHTDGSTSTTTASPSSSSISTSTSPSSTTSENALELQKRTDFEPIISMLERSAREYHNNDALLLLAELNFFSKYTYPRNYRQAFEHYQALANKGNATAQQMVGFMYATGIGNAVQRDQAKALLYHTFAAHGGDIAAEMTMGYRYLLGIGNEKSCEDALYHYKSVASKVIDYYLSGPPGGRTPPLPKVRLSEEEGGIYGYGASMMTERRSRHSVSAGGSDKSVSIEEILQYWRYLASKQDIDAQVMLGQVYYMGTRNIPRNFNEAFTFFHQIVDKASSSGKIPSRNSKAVGQAAGYLGQMYWRGEGVKVDEKTAFRYFQIGAELGDANSQTNLGSMYLNGIAGVAVKNKDKAIEYFKKAAEQENPHAQVNLAIEYAQSEMTLPLAIRLFTKAADAKHLLAYWYLAQMNEQNLIPRPSCTVAVSYYKAIAERGDWLNPTVEAAYSAYKNDDLESALLYYMLAAERGYEIAQSNAAYLLDKDKRMLDHLPLLGSVDEDIDGQHKHQRKDTIRGINEEESAFIYWSRSANQNNIDARIKLGDYYYKGIGTPVNFEKAAACYRLAAEIQGSPLAFWNLGWMYETGVGVAKDFHLAKRAYDQALNIDQDAYLPVKVSLIRMYIKYYWNWITGRDVGTALHSYDNDANKNSRESDSMTEFKKSSEYVRKQVEEANRQKNKQQYDIGEEMERQYRLKKQKEKEEQERLADDDPFHSESSYSMDGYNEEDELFESLLILILCLLVGYLVYVRQFRFGGNLNNNQNNNNNNNNRNNFNNAANGNNNDAYL
ncbi:hypothetical protein BDF20DRAFT_916506 [Mycotypha africana]|uniref:uncharacterized protein n=1 Tax=Mycotypha africana TaxID=64632 RepID=UPI002301A6AB|nr:uncharacterized protein BDF20DRAFT_916506 [Mycotypha africana]KAI8969117.1 hypothetical protein BDF20DRAFT_916506 [Mycotypha africana]